VGIGVASPTFQAAQHERIDPDDERAADRIGIRLLQDELNIRQGQAATIAEAFQTTKGAMLGPAPL
jgi:hypothetical protein